MENQPITNTVVNTVTNTIQNQITRNDEVSKISSKTQSINNQWTKKTFRKSNIVIIFRFCMLILFWFALIIWVMNNLINLKIVWLWITLEILFIFKILEAYLTTLTIWDDSLIYKRWVLLRRKHKTFYSEINDVESKEFIWMWNITIKLLNDDTLKYKHIQKYKEVESLINQMIKQNKVHNQITIPIWLHKNNRARKIAGIICIFISILLPTILLRNLNPSNLSGTYSNDNGGYTINFNNNHTLTLIQKDEYSESFYKWTYEYNNKEYVLYVEWSLFANNTIFHAKRLQDKSLLINGWLMDNEHFRKKNANLKKYKIDTFKGKIRNYRFYFTNYNRWKKVF